MSAHLFVRELEDHEAEVLQLVATLRVAGPLGVRAVASAPRHLDDHRTRLEAEVDSRERRSISGEDPLADRSWQAGRPDQRQEPPLQVAVAAAVRQQLVEQDDAAATPAAKDSESPREKAGDDSPSRTALSMAAELGHDAVRARSMIVRDADVAGSSPTRIRSMASRRRGVCTSSTSPRPRRPELERATRQRRPGGSTSNPCNAAAARCGSRRPRPESGIVLLTSCSPTAEATATSEHPGAGPSGRPPRPTCQRVFRRDARRGGSFELRAVPGHREVSGDVEATAPMPSGPATPVRQRAHHLGFVVLDCTREVRRSRGRRRRAAPPPH